MTGVSIFNVLKITRVIEPGEDHIVYFQHDPSKVEIHASTEIMAMAIEQELFEEHKFMIDQQLKALGLKEVTP